MFHHDIITRQWSWENKMFYLSGNWTLIIFMVCSFFLFGLFCFCSLLHYFNLSFWLSSSGVFSLVSSSSLTVLPHDSLTPVLRSDWRILMSVHIQWNQNWSYSGPNVSRREKRRNWERTQRRQNKLQEHVSGSDEVQRTRRRIRRVIVRISEGNSRLVISSVSQVCVSQVCVVCVCVCVCHRCVCVCVCVCVTCGSSEGSFCSSSRNRSSSLSSCSVHSLSNR